MSLINNALKKAQRERAAEVVTSSPGGSTHFRRGPNGPAPQTIILIIAGAAAIVVLSIVGTMYFLHSPTPATTRASDSISNHTSPSATPSPSPAIMLPVIRPPTDTPQPTSDQLASTEPAPATGPTHATPEIPRESPPSTQAAPADARVYTFIDNLQIMGVRASGADSKVLMNDKVYRLGDNVDRALSLRLVSVSPNSLVFEDANGVQYTKTF